MIKAVELIIEALFVIAIKSDSLDRNVKLADKINNENFLAF